MKRPRVVVTQRLPGAGVERLRETATVSYRDQQGSPPRHWMRRELSVAELERMLSNRRKSLESLTKEREVLRKRLKIVEGRIGDDLEIMLQLQRKQVIGHAYGLQLREALLCQGTGHRRR